MKANSSVARRVVVSLLASGLGLVALAGAASASPLDLTLEQETVSAQSQDREEEASQYAAPAAHFSTVTVEKFDADTPELKLAGAEFQILAQACDDVVNLPWAEVQSQGAWVTAYDEPAVYETDSEGAVTVGLYVGSINYASSGPNKGQYCTGPKVDGEFQDCYPTEKEAILSLERYYCFVEVAPPEGYQQPIWPGNATSLTHKSMTHPEALRTLAVGNVAIPNYLTVSFELNGGVGDFPSITVPEGDSVEIHAETPIREGHKFLGWLGLHGAARAGLMVDPGEIYTPYAVTTFVAQWEADEVNPGPEPGPGPAPEPEPEPAPVPEPESLAQTGASDLALVVLGGTGLLALGISSASARKER